MQASTLVIALDGPSGAGKSSVARAVAESLGQRYLDTGAMYRAVTWWMLRHEVDVDDSGAVAALADKPQLRIGTDARNPTIDVDGSDVSEGIRTPAVSRAVSAVSAVPEVRRRMVDMQVDIIGDGGIVVEGRDIGTVVAPTAPVKVFLTATSEERAQRRTKERGGEGARAGRSADATHVAMQRRDRLDSGRGTSPLTKADDAVEIDSTALGLDEVVRVVLRLVRERTGAYT